MKKIIFLTFTLFSQSGFAWTLAGQQGVAFKVKEVTINIASTSCANAGFDTATLLNHVKNSIDTFWNKVAESSLELKIGSVEDINIDGQTSASAVATNLTPDNTILVGCNDDVTTFTDGFTGGIGAIYCNSSGVCRGAVIMNAHASSNVDTLSNAEILTVLGHELGHALGLGHSSVKEALMYYSISNKTQEFLHQDDINGFSWLYPNEKKLGGLAGSCATVDLGDKSGPGGPGTFFLTLMIGIALIIAMEKLGIKLKQSGRGFRAIVASA